MSNVNSLQTRSELVLLRRSARLLKKRLGAEDHLIKSNPSTPDTCGMEMDTEEHQKEIQESPIITTPRRKVGKPRSFNMKARIRANLRVQELAKLKYLYEVVIHELICRGAREQRFMTVDDVDECFDRHELAMQ